MIIPIILGISSLSCFAFEKYTAFLLAVSMLSAAPFLVLSIKKPIIYLMLCVAIIPLPGIGIFTQLKYVIPLLLIYLLLNTNINFTSIYEVIKGNKAIFTSIILLSIGIATSVTSSVLRKSIDINFLTQVTFLLLEILIATMVIYSITKNHISVERVLNIFKYPFLLISFLIIAAIFRSGAISLMKIKHIMIFNLDINSNLPAMVLAPLTMIMIGKIKDEKQRNKISILLYAILGIIATFATNSRGAWMGVSMATLYVIFRSRKINTILVIAFLATIVTLYFGDFIVSRFKQTMKLDYSTASRFLLWSYALQSCSKHLFWGLGPNGYSIYKFKMGFPKILDPEGVKSSHNMLIEMCANFGIIFLVGFLLITTYIFINLDRIGKSENEIYSTEAISVNAALIAFLVHGIFDCGIANLSIASTIIIIYSLGILIILNTKRASS